MKTSRVVGWLGPILVASAGLGDEPRPVISVRAIHPDRQARAILGLFDGARSPSPAAALAAWKRASREPGRLGKPVEALIAAINPAMAGELGTLDGAEVAFWFEPGDGRVGWGATIPADDGTFAALGTAFVLSGGRAEPPMGEVAVDRLAGPGSTLLARGPEGTLMGGTRSGLQVARDRGARPGREDGPDGLCLQVEPGALLGAGSPAARRLAEALGPGSGPHTARVAVRDRSIVGSVDLALPIPGGRAAIEPGWLDWVPAGRASAGFAVAVVPGEEAWATAFEAADRVERVDPARARLAPLRLRLGLLARAAGVRLEADLRPHLQGVSGWVGSGGESVDAGLVAIHLDDEAAAGRLAERVRPVPGQAPAPVAGVGRELGLLDGRRLRMLREGRSLLVAWGDGVLEDSLIARESPPRSAGVALRRDWEQGPPTVSGGVWLSRMPGLIPRGSPLARALDEAPPMTWVGGPDGPARFSIRVRWAGLDASVRRFLDLIPLDPPPDR